MTIKDKLGREIKVGSYIIYPTVGTIGEVLDTKTDDNGESWVLISVDELTKLWYNTKYVELTDKAYMRNTNPRDSDEKEEEMSFEDIEEEVNTKIDFEMGDERAEGV